MNVGNETRAIAPDPDLALLNEAARPWWNSAWIVVAVGIAVRLALSSVSLGSNDAENFLRFTNEIREHGLLGTYAFDHDFNHPLPPALWAMLTGALSHYRLALFAFLFRLAPIAADGVSIYLLWRLGMSRGGARAALLVAGGFALNLDSILVSGFHCNTDSCYAMFCLLAAYLIEEHEWDFRGGLALAAAINVKLIPVLLILPLLLSYRDFRRAGRFLAGLSIGVIPFLPALLIVRGQFLHNVVAYSSYLDRWGLLLLFIGSHLRPDTGSLGDRLALFYYSIGRILILSGILTFGLVARRLRRWDRYELCAVTFMLFLVLTPGFGVQYTALIGPLLFAMAPRIGFLFASTAGLFLLCDYAAAWHGEFPIHAHFTGPMSTQVALLGLAAWTVLVCGLYGGLRRIVFPGTSPLRDDSLSIQ